MAQPTLAGHAPSAQPHLGSQKDGHPVLCRGGIQGNDVRSRDRLLRNVGTGLAVLRRGAGATMLRCCIAASAGIA